MFFSLRKHLDVFFVAGVPLFLVQHPFRVRIWFFLQPLTCQRTIDLDLSHHPPVHIYNRNLTFESHVWELPHQHIFVVDISHPLKRTIIPKQESNCPNQGPVMSANDLMSFFLHWCLSKSKRWIWRPGKSKVGERGRCGCNVPVYTYTSSFPVTSSHFMLFKRSLSLWGVKRSLMENP